MHATGCPSPIMEPGIHKKSVKGKGLPLVEKVGSCMSSVRIRKFDISEHLECAHKSQHLNACTTMYVLVHNGPALCLCLMSHCIEFVLWKGV